VCVVANHRSPQETSFSLLQLSTIAKTMEPTYRPMIEKQSSLRKLKKSHVLQNVLKQIKDDTGKLWRSARSLTGTDDEEHGHDHEHEHDPNHNPSPAPEHQKSVPPTIDTKLMEGN
jgi:hypothetical protein